MAGRPGRSRADLLGFVGLGLGVLALPLVGGGYRLSVMIFIAIFAIATMGLCLLMGYAGQVSLGHAAFYGLGAYISALLSVRLGWAPWLTIAVAAAATAGVAYLVGIPILRLKGHYLAMGTLGLGIIVYIGMVELVELTGGPSGFGGIPHLGVAGFVFDRDASFYYLVWAVLLAATALALNVVNSPIGRALRAIHGSELAAETLGVDTSRQKLKVFELSAAYAAVAGSLYAHYVTFVSPASFGFHFSIELVVMAAVGGLASIWGAIFGAAAVIALTELLRVAAPAVFGQTGGEQELILFGVILMAIMVFLPEGLTSGLLQLRRRASRRRRDGGTARQRDGETARERDSAAVPPSRRPAVPPSPLLEVRGLSRSFGGVAALQGVSFELWPGEILAVIGPNGAGKTTLFNLVGGVLPPSAGEARLDGQRLTGRRPFEVAALGVARTFQNLQLFGNMSVAENLLVARERTHSASLLAVALRLPSVRAAERRTRDEVERTLELVGLRDRRDELASELPFGLQRLLEIARALATEPRLVLLDEPAAGLAAGERARLVELIRQTRDGGATILLVEHDMGLVMGLADRVVVLDHGEKIAEGPPAAVQADKLVIAAYLGEDEP